MATYLNESYQGAINRLNDASEATQQYMSSSSAWSANTISSSGDDFATRLSQAMQAFRDGKS